MLKGGGSDNASALRMLDPAAGIEGVEEFLVELVTEKASSACPPLVVGVAIGGTFDTAAALAKKALLRPIGSTHDDPSLAELESRLLDRVNSTGIGPAGLGGDTTALAVHVVSAPSHIAALPVAINLGCSAMRSVSVDVR
jgi:tartrate/fumarate subfamily iron-sulfur-dependent hydro-lyase alpha chain